MKVLKKTALLLIALITYTSCNYLDIVPDEMDREENAFEDPNAAFHIFLRKIRVEQLTC